MTDQIDRLQKLAEPFPASAIGKLPRITCRDCSQSQTKNCGKHQKQRCQECGNWISTAHIHLDYVGHANVTARLLNVDPEWTWEPIAFDSEGNPLLVRNQQGAPIGLWIKLTVLGVTRFGFGSCEPGKFDPIKELIGDALRNAAMRFGVALDLWSKEDLEVLKSEAEESRPEQAPSPSPKTGGKASGEVVAKPENTPSGPQESGSGPAEPGTSPAESEGVEAAPQERESGGDVAEAPSGEALKTILQSMTAGRVSQGDVLKKAAELTGKSVSRKELGTLSEDELEQITTALGLSAALV